MASGGSDFLSILNNSFTDIDGDGFQGGGDNLRIEGNTFTRIQVASQYNQDHSDSIQITGGTNVTILKNKFKDSSKALLVTEPATPAVRQNWVVAENLAYNVGNFCFSFNPIDNLIVRNNTCWNNLYGVDFNARADAVSTYTGRKIYNNIFGPITSPTGAQVSISFNDASCAEENHNIVVENTLNLPYCASDIVGPSTATQNAIFNNLAANDYSLSATSIAKDAGTNSPPGVSATDFLGSSRIAGTAPDIGAYEFTSGSTGTSVPGDLNNDSHVTITDLSILLSHYGQSGQTLSTGDCNNDGAVTVTDLSILLSHYGT
jgi:hypothetical protein